jgi:hypothetical protein
MPAVAGTAHGDMPVTEKRRTLYSPTRDEMQNCQWLKPQLVAQIEFAEWTRWSLEARELSRLTPMIKSREELLAQNKVPSFL